MDLQLHNKVIIVSGGAKGIGAAIVRALGDEGAVPVIVDRDVPAGELLRSELQAGGHDCLLISVGLSTGESCRAAVQQTFERLERIDALVNNAGVNDKIGLESGSPLEFLASLERNLLHYYGLAHYALPHLKAAQGAIVNIASKVAVVGQGGTSGYAAAKGAILALTREWAVELLPWRIRVNTVVPAEVMTSLHAEWINTFDNPEEKLKAVVSRIPLEKRLTEAEEIAAMVIFLLSARAGHITGQHLFVDGGYVHLDRALT